MSESAQRLASILEFPPDFHTYDLDFRPISYWDQPVTSLLATIKAEHQRQALSEALSTGQISNAESLIGELDEMTQKQLEAIHPSFMGGAYLPDCEDWEVEVARGSLNSTTGDVIAIWAQPSEQGIAYRMVDEYEDDGSFWSIWPEVSNEPLTFAEIIEVLVSASNIHWGDGDRFGIFDFRTRCEYDAHGFLSYTSFFYPELTRFFEEEEQKRNSAVGSRIDGDGANHPLRKLALELLISYCMENRRVCPNPTQWAELFRFLAMDSDENRKAQPPDPFILGAWRETSAIDKMIRFEEHIRLAADCGEFDRVDSYIRSLREEDWHHFED